MKDRHKIMFRVICVVILTYLFIPVFSYGERVSQSEWITEWDMIWTEQETSAQHIHAIPSTNDDWIHIDSTTPRSIDSAGRTAAWIKVMLPELQYDHLGLYIPEIYAQHIAVYLDGHQIYEVKRDYYFDENRILLTVDIEDSGKPLFIWMGTMNELDERFGIHKGIQIGDYNELLSHYVNRDLMSIILGATFIFIAIILLICSFFLSKKQVLLCFSLFIVILMIGILFITYPSYLFIFFENYGEVFYIMFVASLLIAVPALLLFFELIFGPGYWSIITKLRKFQFIYSLFCLLFLIVNYLASYAYSTPFYFAAVVLLGLFMIIHLLILCILSIHRALKMDKDAIIFSCGVALLTLGCLVDLISFYVTDSQSFFLWRWGAVCFVIALIILLARNLSLYHKQISDYSKQLEKFSSQLQRSEKMEIISELAASIAHEVRNPLQVTRGFLQLFAEKNEEKDREYMNLAILELDRAANIITDFLTFAKPQIEEVSKLNVVEELKHVEGIIVPLANLQGGRIILELSANLFILGNSAKFKQAIINIVKNSIEAFIEEGTIIIRAFQLQDEVIIEIMDNGEGMDSEGLSRLGEPYFSTKTKGTGLGLMVTFRIIEIMRGNIMINSKKGEGTHVKICFPVIK